jgi:hypothetical protein
MLSCDEDPITNTTLTTTGERESLLSGTGKKS